MDKIVTEKRCGKCGGAITQVYLSKGKPVLGCSPCRSKYFSEYRDKNREKERERARRHGRNNKEKKKEQNKKHKEAHRREYSNYQRARKQRLRGNGGSFTAREWQELCGKYGNKCVACGKTARLAADHVVPVVLGGSSFIENIQPLCHPCNSRKGTSVIDYR